jgi:hypothetical protein
LVDFKEEKLGLERQENEQKKRKTEKVRFLIQNKTQKMKSSGKGQHPCGFTLENTPACDNYVDRVVGRG